MRLNVLPKKGRNRTDNAAGTRIPRAKRTGKRLAIVGAMALALVGGFAGYTYADDTVPDFFSDPVGAVQATLMKVTGQSRAMASWVVDDPTTNNWFDGEQGVGTADTTKTTGRIWTDKTVFGGDAELTNTEGNQTITVENDNANTALVSLSALSSAATIRTSDTEVQPLDIVLVLDTSEDMNTPMEDGTTRIDALKKAANAFVAATLAENQSIDDATKHHRISLVKFGGNASDTVGNQTYYDEVSGTNENNTQIVTGLDYVNDESDLAALNSAISGLTAMGDGSQVNLGLEKAQDSFGQASTRSDAQKIIIVLSAADTPQTPNWDPVLRDSVNGSADIKDSGTDIYCIGVFDRADASATNGPNRYMQAISSNYPGASASGTGLSDIDLGERGEGNYYYAATDSAALNNIFTEIQEQITNSATSPIEPIYIGEDQARPGNLTFVDQLGDFMEVKNFKSIVFAGQKFTQQTSPVTEGNVTTYKFVGSVEGNAVYGPANLSSITIQVESYGDTAQQGDKVTVTVPASMIPLRYYDIEEYEGTITKHEYTDAYPLRVFYTVGVKDDVLNALDEPSTVEGLENYIKANASGDNDVDFYSNAFTEGADEGKTTATFTPATTNSFYYFTEPTQLYTDAQCSQPLQGGGLESVKEGGPYYYERVWYEGAQRKTEFVKVEAGSELLDHISQDEYGQWSIDEGTPRLTRAEEFVEAKDPNRTETANNVISPSWAGSGNVTVALGNNGKVTHTVPGNLDISKDVEWGNGTPDADVLFTFKVDIAGEDIVVPGDFTYTIYEGKGTDKPLSGGTGTIKDGDTIQLKDGQHVVIEDIPGGLTYTVTETVPAGFKTNHNETTDEETKVTTSAAAGTITSKQTSNVEFTNTYTLQEATLEGNPNLKVTKTIDGRAWMESDKFDFTLTPDMEDATTSRAVDDGAIKFGSVAATADSKLETSVEYADAEGASGSDFFGDITFTKPGTYQFVVQEAVPSDAENNVKDGITYTTDKKTVTVTVEDNGDGTMTPTVGGDALAFTNTYKATGKLENVAGTKTITGRDFKKGDSFTFNVTGSATALDGDTFTGTVPMPNNTNTVTINPDSGTTADVAFGTITFTQEGVYTYTFKEQAPEGAAEDNDWTVNGITYDVAEKTIVVKVEDVDHNGTFKVTVTTPDNGNVASALAWNNTYKASPNTGVIGGAKTLTGRNWLEGETYDFKLEPNNDTTVTAVKDGKIDGFTVESDTIEPLQLESPVSANGAFSFSELTFKETGDYQFKITEVMPNGASTDNKWTVNGVTYDSHTAIVNVKVTDPGDGKLKVEVTPSTEEGQENAFTNSYEVAPLDYALSLSGTKTVDDQVGTYELKADTFKFVLTPDDAAYPLPTGEDVTRVDKDDTSKGVYVTNKAPEGTADEAAFQLAGTITFTKEGAYTYTLTEDKTPQSGITFDQSVYHIAVTVEEDPATGTLEVTGVSVTKGDGDEAITDGMSKLDFTNTYSAGSVEGTISATKNLSGRNFKPEDLGGDAFTFAVKVSGTDAGGAAMTAAQLPKPANTQVTEGDGFYSYTYALTVTSDGTGDSGTTTFNPVSLTYTRPGTYTFEISENAPTDKNITKDDTVYTVTVVVEEQTGQDGEPVLAVASTTVKAGDSAAENGVVFNNAYTATGAQSVEITKQLSNRAWDDNDEFTFTLKAFDDSTKTAVKDRTVVLPGVENPTDGDEPATITITKADGVENVYAKSFGDITFNKTGTYKFLVQEQVPEGAQNDVYQGVSYDADPRLVTITVSHDYQGGFDIEQKVTTQDGNGTASLTFNNRYDASDAKLDDLAVTKTLTGRTWLQGDEFSFELAVDADKDTDNATANAIEQGNIDLPGSGLNATATLKIDSASTQAGDGSASKIATFDDITFKTEGTFYFKLTEAAHSITGVSHDNSVKYIKVVVEDDGDGQLIATSTVTDDNGEATTLTFTNTYTAKGFTTSFDVQKTFPAATWNDATDEWTGRDWTDNDTFEYTLTLKSGDADGVQIAGGGTSELGKPQSGTVSSGKLANVTFTKAGEYTFDVTETKPAQTAGVSYDAHTATITVKVEHDYANGTFKIAEGYPQYANSNAAAGDVTITSAAAFTNVYEPTTDTTTLSVKKVLTGRDWDADDSFTFTLAANNTTTQDAVDAGKIVLPQDAANGITVTDETEDFTDSFGAITFKAPGNYQFKITETVPVNTDGITYPTSSSIVNVNVRDNGEGQLVATVAEGEQTTTVTNMYGASGSLDGGIKVSKTLTGRDNDEWLSTDSFTFSIAPENNAAKQAVEKQLIVLPNDVTIDAQTTNHTAEFGKISFGDVEDGTYTFTVTENAVAANSGITPGGESYTVAIRVTDESGDGTLTVELLDEAGNAAVVERTLAFTNTYKATGTLADGSITVEKVLAGRTWTGSDSFEFKLTPKSDNAKTAVKNGSIELPKNASDGITITSENDHQASFGAITFDDVVDGDYVFTVTETAKSGDGISYATAQDVTITVEDDDAGTLRLTPATTKLTFTNTYDASSEGDAAAKINATKTLTGRDMKAGEFDFEVRTNPTGEGAAEPVLVATGTNAAGADGTAAKVTFKGVDDKGADKALTFDLASLEQAVKDGYATEGVNADGQRQWTLSYTATEKTDTDVFEQGVSPVKDATSFDFELVVTDDGQGRLTVTANDAALAFKNTYKATGAFAADTIKVKKNLTGRELQDGDTFAFEIALDTEGLAEGVASTIKLPTSPITVTKDTADATEAFGAIAFTDTPDGEYTFTVREVIPDEATNPDVNDGKTAYKDAGDEQKVQSGWQLEGVTYDNKPQGVTVTVADDGAGKLDVALKDGAKTATLTFDNSYTAKPYVLDGSTDLKVSKTLSGSRAWGEGEIYTIELAAKDGAPMPADATDGKATLTLDKPGSGKTATDYFDAITFDKTGTYTYTITEKVDASKDEDEDTAGVQIDGVTYSQAAYEVTVAVTDEGHDGQLDAMVTMKQVKEDNGDAADATVANKTAAFTNTYVTEPLVLEAETDLDLAGTKTMDGRDFQTDDTFTFRITKADGTTVDPSKTEVTITPTSGKSANLTFGDDTTFAFTEAGTYVYYIVEDNPNVAEGGEGLPGVSYDPLQYRLTIKVKDNGAGKMELDGDPVLEHQKAVGSSEYETATGLAFKNVYSADSRDLALRATKTLAGDTLEAGEFTFTLTPMGSRTAGSSADFTTDADQPMPKNDDGTVNDTATNDGDGSITFGSMTFDQTMIGKEFQYKVTEQQPTVDGTYDGAALAGATKDDQGNWVYKGVTYTHEERFITATVSRAQDEDGNEYVRVDTSGEGEKASFTNTYNTEETMFAIPVTKELENRDSWLSADEFTFELAATKATQEAIDDGELTMPDATTVKIGAGDGDHRTTFDAITFNEPGTYTFTVTEQVPARATNTAVDDGATTYEQATAEQKAETGWQFNGVTYDNEPKTVAVEVTDEGDGTMTAAIADTSAAPVFTNTYGAAPTKATFAVQKTLDGRAWRTDETYSFTLRNTDAPEDVKAPMPADTTVTIGKPASGNIGSTAFETLTFDKPGTYTYKIAENVPTGDDVDATMNYDTHAAIVTVYVSEMQSTGKLFAIVSYNNDAAEDNTAPDAGDKLDTSRAAFTNAQQLETSFELEGTKTIEGRVFQQGDAFTFTVTAKDGAPLPSNVKTAEPEDATGTITIDPTSGDRAAIDFGTISFDGKDMGVQTSKTFTYMIAEQAGDATGMTYDTRTRTVTIQVDNDGDGNLTATLLSDESDLTWTNVWDFVAGEAFSLPGIKTLTGAELTKGQFAFRVEPVDDAPVVASPVENGEATYDEETDTWTAPIQLFDEVAFDDHDDYVYRVTEIDDEKGGYTYDNTQYRVTVHVAQDGSTSYTVERSDDGTDWADAADNAVTFANTYTVGDTATLAGETDLAGTKALDGRDWLDTDEFTFELAAGDADTQAAIDGDPAAGIEPTITMPAETSVTLSGGYSDGAKVPFHFGDITFTEEGDYTFTIAEKQPGSEGFEGNTGGMAYDDHVRTIAVQVRDNGQGVLNATVAKDGTSGSTDWVNEYTTGTATLTGSIDLVVTKQIANRDWLEDDAFTFMLAAGDTATEEAIADKIVTMPDKLELTIDDETVDADGKHSASFGDITFTEDGIYTFTVTETGESHDGLAYDTEPRTIKVEVTDEGDGDLTAKVVGVTPDAGLTFTNTYSTSGTGDLASIEGFTKVLDGRAWNQDDTFTFEIKAVGGKADDGALINAADVPMPDEETVTVGIDDVAAKPNADGNDYATFSFGAIEYAAEGTYTYEVSEVKGDNDGIDYSDNVATVTVAVTDNLHGGLSAAVVEIEQPEFVNTYGTQLDYVAEGNLSIVKNLTGHAIAEGQFEFTVTAGDEDSAAKAGFTAEEGLTRVYPVGAASMDDDGTATSVIPLFSETTFDHTESGNTYTYTVVESQGGDTEQGYTNDTTEYTVTIKVADDEGGKLTVTTTVDDDDPTTEPAVYTYTNGEDAGDPAQVVFDNEYDASAEVTIVATKELTNGELEAGDFSFRVDNEATDKTIAMAPNAVDGSIDFGSIAYTIDQLIADKQSGACVYSEQDGTYTYTYRVWEYSEMPEGVTPVAASFQVNVVVTDNDDGTLDAQVIYPEGYEDGLAFVNAYGEGATAQLAVGGTKTLAKTDSSLNPPDITGEYTFTLTGVDEDGNAAPLPDVTEVVNDGSGSVNFGTIEYTMANVFGTTAADEGAVDEGAVDEDAVEGEDVAGDTTDAEGADEGIEGDVAEDATDSAEGDATDVEGAAGVDTDADVGAHARIAPREKTFTYTVTESGEVAGVTNDPDPKRTFTVTVKDNGDGTLSVESDETPGAQFAFTNTYGVEPVTTELTGDGGLTVTKVLEGVRPLAADEFTFVMRDAQTGEEVARGTNDDSGNVEFGAIEFDKPGVYRYTISEVDGDLPGVTYDTAAYLATATVTDDQDGTLSVAWKVTAVDDAEGAALDELTFTNVYRATEHGRVVFGAIKTLDGRKLAEGEFAFELRDAEGNVLQTAKNAADGSVTFAEPVEFDKAGDYAFQIAEVLPADDDPSTEGVQHDGVTYDETVYDVSVTVTDDLAGSLVAAVSYGENGELPSFANTYIEQGEPGTPGGEGSDGTSGLIPQTGDYTLAAVGGIGAVAVALVACGVALRRRNGRS